MLAYFVLAVLLFWPIWRHDPGSRTALGADQGLSTWFLAWTPTAILHGHNPFFSNYANFPGGVNLLNNTGLTLLGIIGAPITLAFGPIATTNVLLTAGPALSATAAYALIRRFTTWRPAAFAGGLLYGFSPFVILHAYIHLNFTFVCLPPLIFLVLHELVVRQRPSVTPMRWGLLLGGLITAQFFVSSEVMATTVVIGATTVAITAIVGGHAVRAHAAYATKGLAWAGGTVALLLAYPVWFLLRGSAHIVGPIQLTPQAYRSDLLGLFVPGRFQLIGTRGMQHTASRFANMESGSYLGLPLIVVLAVGAVWLRHRSVVVVAAVTAAISFVLSLGGALAVSAAPATNQAGDAVGRIQLPEAVLAKLPLLRNIIPARFAMYVTLFVGLLLACVLEEIHRVATESHPRWTFSAPAVVAVVALVPMIPAASPITVGATGTPAYYTSNSVHAIPAGSVAIVYPFPSGSFADPSLWQALSDFRFRMPGGYFRVPQPPADHIAFSPLLGYTEDTPTAEVLVALGHGTAPPRTAALKKALLRQFETWHVESFVATPNAAANPATSLAFFKWLLGTPSERSGTTYAWYHLQRALTSRG